MKIKRYILGAGVATAVALSVYPGAYVGFYNDASSLFKRAAGSNCEQKRREASAGQTKLVYADGKLTFKGPERTAEQPMPHTGCSPACMSYE